MSVTEDVLRAICHQTAGDTAREVELHAIGAMTGLDRTEVHSAMRALELAGVLAIVTTNTDVRVRLTEKGRARCRSVALHR